MNIFNWFKKKKKVEECLNRRNHVSYYGNSNNVLPIIDWSDNSTITSHDHGNFGGGESNGGGAGGGWGDSDGGSNDCDGGDGGGD